MSRFTWAAVAALLPLTAGTAAADTSHTVESASMVAVGMLSGSSSVSIVESPVSIVESPAVPPTVRGAQENAIWWNGLSAEEQEAYIRDHTAVIGGMDGLPTWARHKANMGILRGDAAHGHDLEGARALLDRIEGSESGPSGQWMYLLGYKPPGRDGSPDAIVIVAIGDPDIANHTGIFVPGTGTDLDNIDGNLDRMGDLKAEAQAIPGSGYISIIVWLGYDAPDTIPAAARLVYAVEGAPALRSFTEGLRASHKGSPSHTTVIGHSYGSTVVGTADALGGQDTDDGLEADDIIAMGSPGMGVESPDRRGWFDGELIDDVTDMHISEDHFWAGAAADDVVSYVEEHGNSPVNRSFGGRRITTAGAEGHSEYWDPGTEALRNQAYILTANYDKVATLAGRRSF